MDARQLTETKKRAAKVDKQVGELQARRVETESKLTAEHAEIRRIVLQRQTLIGQLVDAADEAARRLHRQIDGFDSAIRGSERLAESFQKLLDKTVQELESARSEYEELNKEIQIEENALAFEAWCLQIKTHLRNSEESISAARSNLGQLSQLAGEGIEKFRGPAAAFLTPLVEKFARSAHNPDLHGWKRPVPSFISFGIQLHPMIRQ